MQERTNNPTNQSARIICACYSALLIALFFFGFFAGEGKYGAAKSDFYEYHLPAINAFHENPWSIAVSNYSSATTPLFHMLGSLNPFLAHDEAFRASYTIFCLGIYFLFVALLRVRFGPIGDSKGWAWVVGGTLLLSPYFRTQAFWPLTDNLALMFVILSALLMELLVPRNERKRPSSVTKLLIASVPLSTLCAFYTRQTYLFLSCYAIIFLWSKLRLYRWFLLSIVPFLLPALYLFKVWHGLVPPDFQGRHQGFSFGAILFPLVMVMFYATPFILNIAIQKWSVLLHPNRKTLITLAVVIAGGIPFWMIFYRDLATAYAMSGGILVNTLHMFGTKLGPALFLIAAYLGLLVLYFLGRICSLYSNLLLILFFLTFLSLKVDFQRYFDPLLIVLFFGYIDRSVVQRFATMRAVSILAAFEAILCLGGILHTR